MAGKPLCFLHAANLQLDCPLRGIGALNDEIRDIVDVATLTAFDRMISTSIHHDVDAIFITGNTFDSSYPSLAAEVALREGFERLKEHQIPVFITPGPLDPAVAWHDMPRFPDNVQTLTEPDGEPIELTDHGRLLATILPIAADTPRAAEELETRLRLHGNSFPDHSFAIGLLLADQSANFNEQPLFKSNRAVPIDWLLGPQVSGLESWPGTDVMVHIQRSPQGMIPAETGAQGVTLLELDSHRKTKRTAISLAPVRRERLTQSIDGIRNRDELLERMILQLERLSHFKGELVRIVEWTLDRSTSEAHGWETESAARELAEALTERTDQPDGLRYVHRIHPLEPDLTLVEPGHREVLTEFLLALERRPVANSTLIAKWLSDARTGSVLKPGSWERWTESISPKQVTERAQQLGWKWFASIGKK